MIPALPLSALPPLLSESIRTGLANGGTVFPLLELNVKVPGLEPISLDFGGAFTAVVYPGPISRFETLPRLGTRLSVTA